MKPTVSVVIPCFNAERTITSAIRSVLAQSVQDFEIVVVDDASQDDTYRVAQALCGDYGQLIQHQHNRGPAAARNTAFEAANGTWVCVLDADDILAPTYIELMSRQAAKSPSAFMGSNLSVFFGDAEYPFIGKTLVQRAKGPSDYILILPKLADFIRLGIDVKPFFPLAILRRHGIRQQEAGSEWLEFIADLYRCGLHLEMINEPLYYYRVHDGNYSSRFAQVEEEIAACDRLLCTSWIQGDDRSALIEARRRLRRHRPWKALHSRMFSQAIVDFAKTPGSILHGIPLAYAEISKRLFKRDSR